MYVKRGPDFKFLRYYEAALSIVRNRISMTRTARHREVPAIRFQTNYTPSSDSRLEISIHVRRNHFHSSATQNAESGTDMRCGKRQQQDYIRKLLAAAEFLK